MQTHSLSSETLKQRGDAHQTHRPVPPALKLPEPVLTTMATMDESGAPALQMHVPSERNLPLPSMPSRDIQGWASSQVQLTGPFLTLEPL